MYITSLDPENAQKIADGIMQIIPYNINIMDRDGIIIARACLKIHSSHLQSEYDEWLLFTWLVAVNGVNSNDECRSLHI